MSPRCEMFVPYRPYSAPGRCEKVKNVLPAKFKQPDGKTKLVKACLRHRQMITGRKHLEIAP